MAPKKGSPMRLIVSTMKDEGPFILEWVAYYLSIGFTNFIVNSNDCSDGTDAILERLQEMGIVRHIDNPGPWRLGPQAQAYENAEADPWFGDAEWILVCDADEFLDIRVGDGSIDALFAACPWADAFAVQWQLFGHNGVVEFIDKPIIEQMTGAADPVQLWPKNVRAIKTLFRNDGTYKALNTHRPMKAMKRRIPTFKWADGSGASLPDGFKRRGWAFSNTGVGFGRDLARMNHYAVRSMESYLMKRMRGDVNTTSFHPKMEKTGQVYWDTHCWNTVQETSILSKRVGMQEALDELLRDAALNSLHKNAVAYHKRRISELRSSEAFTNFVKRYTNHSGLRGPVIQEEAYVDESIILSAERLKNHPDTSLPEMVRIARLANVCSANKWAQPWFANLDSLSVPLNQHEAEKQLTDPEKYWPGLPQKNSNTGSKDTEKRSIKAVVGSVGQKRNWTLIGNFETDFIRDLLSAENIKTVTVIAPWGMKWAEYNVSAVDVAPDRVEMDVQFFNFLTEFETEIRAGRLRVYRGLPVAILGLFREQSVGIVAIKGQRKPAVAKALLEQVHRVLEPNGSIVFTCYRLRGNSMVGSIHEFIGGRPTEYRVTTVAHPWISIQKLAPLPN